MTVHEKNNFLNLFNEVFDENNKVRLCGREKCKDLILFCISSSGQPDDYFGNSLTGMMNLENIIKFRDTVLESN